MHIPILPPPHPYRILAYFRAHPLRLVIFPIPKAHIFEKWAYFDAFSLLLIFRIPLSLVKTTFFELNPRFENEVGVWVRERGKVYFVVEGVEDFEEGGATVF